MTNLNYKRSYQRELGLKSELEKDGWFVVRASGSHGIADLIAVRPSVCGLGDHYEVKLVQIKVSQSFLQERRTIKVETLPFGLANVEYCYFPVKTKAFYAHKSRFKKRQAKRLQSSKQTKGLGK